MDALFARAFVDGTPPDEGPIPITVGTDAMQIDGRAFAMPGADLSRYEANPVVLWNHNQAAPPVGRALDVRVEGDRLRGAVDFDSEDSFARRLESKYRRGYMNAFSMLPLPRGWRAGMALPRGQVDDWELVEVSAVPIPVDPQAVSAARSAMAHLGQELIELARSGDHDSEVLDAITSTDDPPDPDEWGRAVAYAEFTDLLARALKDVPAELFTDLGFQRSAPAPTQDPIHALKALADALPRPKEGTT